MEVCSNKDLKHCYKGGSYLVECQLGAFVSYKKDPIRWSWFCTKCGYVSHMANSNIFILHNILCYYILCLQLTEASSGI